jgi:hypothetical protein
MWNWPRVPPSSERMLCKPAIWILSYCPLSLGFVMRLLGWRELFLNFRILEEECARNVLELLFVLWLTITGQLEERTWRKKKRTWILNLMCNAITYVIRLCHCILPIKRHSQIKVRIIFSVIQCSTCAFRFAGSSCLLATTSTHISQSRRGNANCIQSSGF